MERIRKAIDRLVSEWLGRRNVEIDDPDWKRIEALILESQPPGVDEICAALRELLARSGGKRTSIQLFHDGTGSVMAWNDAHDNTSWDDGDDIPAAIRSLIPKPEPTPEEDYDVLSKHLHTHYSSYVYTSGREEAREALVRLRERLEAKS